MTTTAPKVQHHFEDDFAQQKFEYGDSLLSFDQKYKRLSGDKYQNPLCEIVFKKESLKFLFTHNSYPESVPLHVEAQLWERPSTEWR